VKHKVTDESWNRADLYEVVAFATAFRTNHAALIGFADRVLAPQTIAFETINVTRLDWNFGLAPSDAAADLSLAAGGWLSTAAC
jgi:hypothetical protein